MKHNSTDGVAAGEPCPRGADKPEPTCTNRHQCWEPCGELGNDAHHVRVTSERDTAAINAALGRQASETQQERGNTICNPHPDAPHGFNRNASHNAGRYICDCEGWMPPGVRAPHPMHCQSCGACPPQHHSGCTAGVLGAHEAQP